MIGKTPVDIVNQLQDDVVRFFELFDYDGDLKPRHIAAEQSHLDLCAYIIEKTKDQNSKHFYNSIFYWRHLWKAPYVVQILTNSI